MSSDPKKEETLLECIRKRPGMFLGGTDKVGLHHLLFWILDDLVANARAGFGSEVLVRLESDNRIYVADHAGFPTFPTEDGWTNAWIGERLERLSTEFVGRDRGVVPDEPLRSYLPLVRALSTTATVAVGPCAFVIEPTEDCRLVDEIRHSSWNSAIRFVPDPEIFGDAQWDLDLVRTRLEDATATCPGLRARLEWASESVEVTMEDGMAGIVARTLDRAGAYAARHQKVHLHLHVREGELAFDVAIQWHWGDVLGARTIQSWANTVRTTEGSHVLGVEDALRALRLDELPYVAAISVFVPHPRFTSPTKGCLRHQGIRALVRDHLTAALQRLYEHDEDFALELQYRRNPTTSSTGKEST